MYSVFRTPFHAAFCERLDPCTRVPREGSGLFCSLPLHGSQCAAEEILRNWGRGRSAGRAVQKHPASVQVYCLHLIQKVDLPGGSACLLACAGLCLPSARSRRSNHDPSWGVQKFV